ncbi:MAG: TonB-dependent receptor [Sphingomonadaceae bacterium]|nr:TonB-dependent receptor [Sphingomonadaceae bacterium]
MTTKFCNWNVGRPSTPRFGGGIALALVLASLATSPASSQEASATQGPEEQEAGGFEEIVVTAQKREENLQSVPISITAVTQDMLSNRDIDTMDAIDRIAPNLLIVPARTSTAVAGITLRGQVQDDPSSITLDQSVGLYVDGVYVARGNGAFQRLYDVERVEVLKGPQGTLYGRNTTGGAINVLPNHPTDNFSVDTKFTVGNYSRREAAAAVNVPLSEGIAARGVFVSAKRDGYAKNVLATGPLNPGNNDTDDENSFYGRLIVDADLSDNLTLSLAYDNFSDKNNGAPVVPIYFNPANSFFGVLSPLRPSDIRVVRQNDRNGIDVKVQGATAIATLDLDTIAIKNIFAYRETDELTFNDFDGTAVNLISTYLSLNQHQYSNELNISGDAGESVEWILGGYWFKEKGRNFTRLGLGLLPGFGELSQIDDGLGRNKSTAVFAQGTFHFSDAFSLTAGARHTWETKKITSFNIGTNGRPLFPGGSASFSKDFTGLTGSISLNYQANEDLFLYAKYGRGFRSGGFNIRGIGPSTPPFDKETVDEFEIGAKSDLAGGRVRANIALFYDFYNDIQRVIQGVFGDPPSPTTTTRNAAKAKIYGGELELSALPTDDLELSVNVGAAIARYDEFMDGPVDRSNNRFPLVPEWTANGMIRYSLPETGLFKPVLQVDASWKDSYDLLVFNTPDLFQPSYTLVNAKIAFEKVAGEDLRVSLFARNIFDKEYILNGRDFGAPFGLNVARYGPPATYGVELEVSF